MTYFKNNVFNVNVNTKEWFKAAGIRAIKTVAQTAIATIGASATMGEVDWKVVGSASLLAGVVSILTSIAGIPEVQNTKNQIEVNEVKQINEKSESEEE